MVLLIGFSLSVMVFAAMSYDKGFKSKSLTSHAATQAQLGAWSGAEAVRQYLLQTGAEISSLKSGDAIAFNGDLKAVSGKLLDVVLADSTYCGGLSRVRATITAPAGPATSTLDVVYCAGAAPGNGDETSQLPTGNNIRGPLDIGGENKYRGSGDGKIYVDGNISGSGSISGYDSVYSSGSVSLRGYGDAKSLVAEGDVDLEGNYGTVQSMKNITGHGGALKVTALKANGNVIDSNGGTYGVIEAIGNVTLTDGTKADTVHSKGTVFGRQSTVNTELLAQGNFEETGCCSHIAAGMVAGAVKPIASYSKDIHLTVDPDLKVSIDPVKPQATSAPVIDALSFMSSANFVFDRDADGHIKVTVHSVSGLTEGKTYFVAGSGGQQDYLCDTATYDAKSCSIKICNGYSAQNTCFGYWNNTWNLNGPSGSTILVPGTVLFKGNVNLGSGHYYNTVLSTGNISTSSDTFVISPNYAGFDIICQNTVFPNVYPSNLCKKGALVELRLGDVALLAGSYDANKQYSGGVINLGSRNEITGNVIAGDVIQTAGNTTISGLVNSGYLGRSGLSNSFGAKTVIDQSRLRQPAGQDTSSTGSASSSASVKVMWARYL
ncbi:hypothetical protein EJP67_29815 [Variovorax guangxiensis]|uniref:Uncharacterized protein n=2 Tax=Variovorax guangxiensis TaxID=1775474 RepID=A0A3S0XE28_9BURK|nr:hypothetical protein EJP67_29815 [Variovorax guangxiensis]